MSVVSYIIHTSSISHLTIIFDYSVGDTLRIFNLMELIDLTFSKQ